MKTKLHPGWVLALLCTVLFFYGFYLGGVQLVISEVSREYGQNAAGMGGLVAAQHVAAVVLPVVLGALADRIGKKPVLCICRGLQLFNVVMGGTLWQDLPSQRPSEIKHSQGKPYGAAAHSVELVPGSPLHALLGQSTIGVNTRHHQAIRELAPSLAVMATSPDGLIESICLPGSRFAWGVQWHPEHMAPEDANSVKIFEAFVDACID